MKRLRLLRWSGTVLSPRTRPTLSRLLCPSCIRRFATASSPLQIEDDDNHDQQLEPEHSWTEERLLQLPSPPVEAAKTSAKLSALHARLSLPSKFPLETLARTLVDPSADPSPRFNNKPFSILGNDLLTYYTSEYIICQYPRLPMAVVYAAMYAYVGPRALTTIGKEWGVEAAAEPGGEVNPGLLQFKMIPPNTALSKPFSPIVGASSEFNVGHTPTRRSISSRTVYDDEFGDLRPRTRDDEEDTSRGITLEDASRNFVRALMGAMYLHGGRVAAKKFYRDQFMSRQLVMSNLFNFRMPARDLSRLCAREGFRAPVARLLSETGRKSRHPVYVVGVFSGNEKLGEGQGSSLDEARTRAAVAALKGWYLYSPLQFRLPSEMEEPSAPPWSPAMVDRGDIVI